MHIGSSQGGGVPFFTKFRHYLSSSEMNSLHSRRPPTRRGTPAVKHKILPLS